MVIVYDGSDHEEAVEVQIAYHSLFLVVIMAKYIDYCVVWEIG